MRYFKPEKSVKKRIIIRIKEDKSKIIDELANRFDMSRNTIIVQCIEYALNNMK